MVIWLIGMSASGKTTIGKKLFDKLQLSDENWIFLDGDTFRNILGEDLGHTVDDRRKNAYRISRFCEYLNSQGVNVLACVLSLFHDNQKYNKDNIADYKEVFIDVSFDNLVRRDNKELYKKALNKDIKDVVGVDIEFQPPYSPDMTIDNNKDDPDYNKMINNIIKNLDIDIDTNYLYTKENLLEKPHKYQYSKFEGEEFFKKLIDDRNNTLSFFNKRLKKLNYTNKYSLEVKKYTVDDNLLLKEFLIMLYLSGNEALIENLNTIELLIKRFEVSKKLYISYSLKEVRKSSSYFEDLLNYPLFSLVLQKYYRSSNTAERFVYINSILKLDDIISSTKSEYVLLDEIYYANLALMGELKIIEDLIC